MSGVSIMIHMWPEGRWGSETWSSWLEPQSSWVSELDPDLLNLSTEGFLLPVLLPFFTWVSLLIVALENIWVQGSGNPHHLPGVTHKTRRWSCFWTLLLLCSLFHGGYWISLSGKLGWPLSSRWAGFHSFPGSRGFTGFVLKKLPLDASNHGGCEPLAKDCSVCSAWCRGRPERKTRSDLESAPSRASLVVQWFESPPANAGDTGSGPGPGRSHVPQSN